MNAEVIGHAAAQPKPMAACPANLFCPALEVGIVRPGSRRGKGVVELLLVLLGLGLAARAPGQVAGTIDPTFSPTISSFPDVRVVALQNDGKVLVGGLFSTVNGVSRQSLVRLNPDGSVDGTFVDPQLNGRAYSLGIKPNGKILLGGTFFLVGGVSRGDFAQLNSNGVADGTFPASTNGNLGADAGVYAITLQPSDGRGLIAGQFTTINETNRTGLARINTDGNADLGYSNLLADADVRVLATQPADGKLLVGGNFRTLNGSPRTNLARLNLDGSVDTTFTARTGPGPDGFSIITALAIQQDGKILIGGVFGSINGIARTNIARLNSDGTLDGTFQNGMGGVTTPPEIGPAQVNSIVQPDPNLILIGGSFTAVNGVSRTNLARLNLDGTLDIGFDAGPRIQPVNSMVAQTNGFVVLGCDDTGSSNGTNAVIRLYAGFSTLTLCDVIPLPPGRLQSDIDPLNPPIVVPPNRTFWDAASNTLYPTNSGAITVSWNFRTAPLHLTNSGVIVPLPVNTLDVTAEITPPGCADTNQVPDGGSSAFWHGYTRKMYATSPGTNSVAWKRPNGSLIPQQFIAQWPAAAQFQIHVANSAPVDVTGGGRFGSPTLLSQEANGAAIVNGQFQAAGPGRSLHLVSAAGAPAQSTNIYF